VVAIACARDICNGGEITAIEIAKVTSWGNE
jgi:hypothetical protein